MRRWLISFLLGGIAGTAFGLALGVFLFPCVFPPPPAADVLSEAERARIVATGNFIHADPADPIHYGSGNVTVYERTVFLGTDFKVGPGPAYHVYLVPRAQVRRSADIPDTMYVDLGGLRAFEGSQRYAVPAGVDLARYASVVIWCERFGVLISPADLTFR
ncbi:MAG: DM13 domain-containing protein [Alphaproteobacteria bacterium]|nr:DM13 domain-containing protein [Alphaproteobacteria bacterium]